MLLMPSLRSCAATASPCLLLSDIPCEELDLPAKAVLHIKGVPHSGYADELITNDRSLGDGVIDQCKDRCGRVQYVHACKYHQQ